MEEKKSNYPKEPCFKDELTALINKHSKENGSDTPDWVLANYLCGCLEVFDETTKIRTDWYTPKGEPLEILGDFVDGDGHVIQKGE